ncbi:hypothetical protein CLD22_12105 [Rubrivivax gelatinosus]|nr:hypothetical protein [Rubrivivax gelatinosus]
MPTPAPAPAPEHPPVLTSDGKLGADIPSSGAPEHEQDLDRIYDALMHGRGREWVDDANVGRLVEMAQRKGDTQLELLLREWRSACGEDAASVRLAPAVPPPRTPRG